MAYHDSHSQCDETRPHCRPCLKAKLTCAYELPAGQTRQQALIENQFKIQNELEAHASLIQTLRCLPAEASARVLTALREGEYDHVLLGTAGSTDGNEVPQPEAPVSYPWEYTADDGEQDAMGEDDEDYSKSTTSPAYSQYPMSDIQHSPSLQFQQQRPVAYHQMLQPGPALPYPGYYAPFPAYAVDSTQSQSSMMGMPAEPAIRAPQNQYPVPQTQQFLMRAPEQHPLEVKESEPRTKKKR
jgi:hypothetical protein